MTKPKGHTGTLPTHSRHEQVIQSYQARHDCLVRFNVLELGKPSRVLSPSRLAISAVVDSSEAGIFSGRPAALLAVTPDTS